MQKLGKDKSFIDRTGEENVNYQGYKMKIVQYNSANDTIIEFQDDYKAKVCREYKSFVSGSVKNPYHPEVYGIGRIGIKYPSYENDKNLKEYRTWAGILQRCYDEKTKEKQPTYVDCIVSEEWKCYENFYEWIHSQPNYEKWKNGKRWTVDKDILVKWNKIYSPDFCSLVPENINALFTRRQNDRGNYPIGVYYYKPGNYFRAQCMNPILNKRVLIGEYDTPSEAFIAYKYYKENIIKQIAEIEYDKGNITKRCYEAMMSYVVEITD